MIWVILHWTARGFIRGIERDLLDLTYTQLKKWGCNLILKWEPAYDIFIDDTLNPLYPWNND